MARRRPRIYRVTKDSFYLFRDLIDDAKPRDGPESVVVPEPHWPPFSPLEEGIVTALRAESPLSCPQVADLLHESRQGRIRGVLANLVERGVIEPTPGGYRLTRPLDGSSDSVA